MPTETTASAQDQLAELEAEMKLKFWETLGLSRMVLLIAFGTSLLLFLLLVSHGKIKIDSL